MNTYKELVLRALKRVLRSEEREADEQARDDIQRDLSYYKRWIAPVTCNAKPNTLVTSGQR